MFGAFWLLYNINSHRNTLIVVPGHEQHVGAAEDEPEAGEGFRPQHKGHAHHMLTSLSDTHDKVRNYYEIFENLAVGAEKLLAVWGTFSK